MPEALGLYWLCSPHGPIQDKGELTNQTPSGIDHSNNQTEQLQQSTVMRAIYNWPVFISGIFHLTLGLQLITGRGNSGRGELSYLILSGSRKLRGVSRGRSL